MSFLFHPIKVMDKEVKGSYPIRRVNSEYVTKIRFRVSRPITVNNGELITLSFIATVSSSPRPDRVGWILHHQCCSINPFKTPISTQVKTKSTLKSPPQLLIPHNGETWESSPLPGYKLDSYSEHLKVYKIVTFPIVFPISHRPLLPFQKSAPLNSCHYHHTSVLQQL